MAYFPRGSLIQECTRFVVILHRRYLASFLFQGSNVLKGFYVIRPVKISRVQMFARQNLFLWIIHTFLPYSLLLFFQNCRPINSPPLKKGANLFIPLYLLKHTKTPILKSFLHFFLLNFDTAFSLFLSVKKSRINAEIFTNTDSVLQIFID